MKSTRTRTSCLRRLIIVLVAVVVVFQILVSWNVDKSDLNLQFFLSSSHHSAEGITAVKENSTKDLPFNPPSTRSKLLQAKQANTGLSIIISAYRQPKCLQQMVQYFRLCPVVQEIRINWFEDASLLQKLPHDFFALASNATDTDTDTASTVLPPVYFDPLPNKITHRFSPHRQPPLASIATFHVDVDTFYSCRALDFAYQTWGNYYHHASNHHTVLGFHPRLLKSLGKYYHVGESYQAPFRYNTIFGTKGAIIHKELLDIFFQSRYEQWRERMDNAITAEDMLLSFVLADNQVHTVALCLQPQDTCSLACFQGQQIPLAQRTASIRPRLLDQLFQEFSALSADDPNATTIAAAAVATSSFLPIKSTADQMIWFNETVKSRNHRCYSAASSQKSISVANRKCRWFCANTPVCPQNPKRKDPVEYK
jgi:hypothetical protein